MSCYPIAAKAPGFVSWWAFYHNGHGQYLMLNSFATAIAISMKPRNGSFAIGASAISMREKGSGPPEIQILIRFNITVTAIATSTFVITAIASFGFGLTRRALHTIVVIVSDSNPEPDHSSRHHFHPLKNQQSPQEFQPTPIDRISAHIRSLCANMCW